ncbi:MAG: hypothetical protein JO329_02030 [Planctomycetaceae bacterium]|nr:hypothetical protein [Planctomycetaceae bacterium]
MISCFFSFVIAIARPKTAGLIKAVLEKLFLRSQAPNLVDPNPNYNPPVTQGRARFQDLNLRLTDVHGHLLEGILA